MRSNHLKYLDLNHLHKSINSEKEVARLWIPFSDYVSEEDCKLCHHYDSLSSKKSRQTDKFLDIEKEKLNTVKQLMKEDEPKDEWRAYVDILVHELRMIKNPRLKISVRNGISKLVGDTIIQQLTVDEQ
ncbi:hypothetical protein ElyMa_000040900 [Elysia marginata]|uniref:Uncharacterized protein n=1 Tax=Elysia marginata TaxID=1093978 RepID=A0AAV4ECT5_9GAST|nr:hypothetical protein ElyMa_000040900 [Elysia marginata]